MSDNVIYLNRQPLMAREPRMKIGLEIDQKSIDLAGVFSEAIPDGVGLDVAGVAGSQFLAGIIAYESDGDIETALKTLLFLNNLIEALTVRACRIIVEKKSGEQSR